MTYTDENFLKEYLLIKYGQHEFTDVSNNNWTYDAEIQLQNGSIITAEIKERDINSDFIYLQQDILVELIQDYRFFNYFGRKDRKGKNIYFGQRPWPNIGFQDLFKGFHKSLGWFYTECMEDLIYVRYIDTESYIGQEVYHINFIQFKSWLTRNLQDCQYRTRDNNKQRNSKSESQNILVPIVDVPKHMYTVYSKVKEK